MTVLAQYQRLEAEGVWRADVDAQRKDVIVSIGDATLTLTDLNDVALAHWSLPAIRRQNPGERPAVYAPGVDAPEFLELADPEMIDAVEKVLRAVRSQGRHPGRLRTLILSSLSVAVLLLAVFWLPGALARYAAAIVPDAARVEIGQQLLRDVETLTGAACDNPAGRAALSKLEQRLFPDGTTGIRIVPSALETTQHVSGGVLLAGHKLVEDHDRVDVLAGYLLAEDMRRTSGDPVERAFLAAGLGTAFRFLATGQLAPDALRAYAEEMIVVAPTQVPAPALAAKFAQADVHPEAYLEAVQRTPSPVLAEVASTVAPVPILSDGDWIALQQICEG